MNKLELQDHVFIEYHELDETEAWKVGMIKELTNAKFGKVTIENMTSDDVCNTLENICTS